VCQRECIGKVSAFALWANVSIWLGSHHANCKFCRPTRRFRVAAHCVLDGPMRVNCPNITLHEMGKGLHTRASRPLWANSSSSARSVHSYREPTSAAILLAVNYVGPRGSLVR